MNKAVQVVCGLSVVLAVAGEGLAHLRLQDQQTLWSGVRQLLVPRAAPLVAPITPETGPAPTVASSGAVGSVVVPRDRMGQYETMVEIDGQRVSMMVDTGATLVVLSFEDADRLGIRLPPSAFDQWVSTANGRAAVARVTLRQMRLGSIALRDVEALVASRHALGASLLGMTFLGRLRSVRVEDGQLALQQ